MVAIEPGARVTLLAGDGRRYAAVAYEGPGPPGGAAGRNCQFALIDLHTAAVTRGRIGCAGREAVTALAVDGGGPAGADPVVYAGVWRGPGQPSPGGRVVALAGTTGVARASFPTGGPRVTSSSAPRPIRSGGCCTASRSSPAPRTRTWCGPTRRAPPATGGA